VEANADSVYGDDASDYLRKCGSGLMKSWGSNHPVDGEVGGEGGWGRVEWVRVGLWGEGGCGG